LTSTSTTPRSTRTDELQAILDDYQAKAKRVGYTPMQGWFSR
jgi:predicted LPLAT superfamily acyltransferase